MYMFDLYLDDHIRDPKRVEELDKLRKGISYDELVSKAKEPFKASEPGATCRGSHQEFNPDAYADREDGTYLCCQCKMFRSVFGT